MRISGRLACAALLAGSLGSTAFGGDLMSYYALALKNDPQLGGAKFETDASKEALKQAWGGVSPHLNFEFDYGYTRQDIRSSDNKVYGTGTTNYGSWQYSFTVAQPLFNYQSFLSIDQARSTISRSEMELEKARQDLILRVAEGYLNVILAQDKVAVSKAQTAALELHHTVAKARTERGAAPITDLYDTEARLAAVQAEQIEAENFLKDTSQALREIVGTDDIQVKRLKGEIRMVSPAPDNSAAWLATTRNRNPDIQILRQKTEISGTEVDRQKAGHYPTLDLQGDYIVKDTQGTLFGGGSNTATYDVLLKFNLPLYQGGTTASKVRETSSLHKSALMALERQMRASERKTLSAFNEIQASISRTAAMKKSIDSQKLVVEAKTEGFKSGLYISLAVLDAEQDLYKYEKEYSEARNNYLLNFVRLNHAVGTLGEEHVRLVNSLLE